MLRLLLLFRYLESTNQPQCDHYYCSDNWNLQTSLNATSIIVQILGIYKPASMRPLLLFRYLDSTNQPQCDHYYCSDTWTLQTSLNATTIIVQITGIYKPASMRHLLLFRYLESTNQPQCDHYYCSDTWNLQTSLNATTIIVQIPGLYKPASMRPLLLFRYLDSTNQPQCDHRNHGFSRFGRPSSFLSASLSMFNFFKALGLALSLSISSVISLPSLYHQDNGRSIFKELRIFFRSFNKYINIIR